ncbi:hypothetical protein WDZ17_10000 [Pseudokineococcus basanitobsidens]|uniref:Type III secretion system (T3SS) SseB-like protein n=1 Tax=Pseudokineococcus basanitobsidens TaxID=1926649 RepID=A0ABU8RKM7_9ACTN
MPQTDHDPDDGLDEEVPLGAVRVETAALLLVDPAHLPSDLVTRLLTPVGGGQAPGMVVALAGDGAYDVISTPDGLGIVDPYRAEGFPHESISASAWVRLTSPPHHSTGDDPQDV